VQAERVHHFPPRRDHIRGSLIALARALVVVGPGLILIARGLVGVRPRVSLVTLGLVAIADDMRQEFRSTRRTARNGADRATGWTARYLRRRPFLSERAVPWILARSIL
jgi:hypothetical protein